MRGMEVEAQPIGALMRSSIGFCVLWAHGECWEGEEREEDEEFRERERDKSEEKSGCVNVKSEESDVLYEMMKDGSQPSDLWEKIREIKSDIGRIKSLLWVVFVSC